MDRLFLKLCQVVQWMFAFVVQQIVEKLVLFGENMFWSIIKLQLQTGAWTLLNTLYETALYLSKGSFVYPGMQQSIKQTCKQISPIKKILC